MYAKVARSYDEMYQRKWKSIRVTMLQNNNPVDL